MRCPECALTNTTVAAVCVHCGCRLAPADHDTKKSPKALAVGSGGPDAGNAQGDLSKEIEIEVRAVASELMHLAAVQRQSVKSRARVALERFEQREQWLYDLIKKPKFWWIVLPTWVALMALGGVIGGAGTFMLVLFGPLIVGLTLFIYLFMFGVVLVPFFIAFTVGREVVRAVHPESPKCEKCKLHEVYLAGECASCLMGRLGDRVKGLTEYKDATAPAVQLAEELGLYSQKAAMERTVLAKEQAACHALRRLAAEAVRRVFEKHWGGPVHWASDGVPVQSYSSPLTEDTLAQVKRLRDEFDFAIYDIVVVANGDVGAKVVWENPLWPGVTVSGTLAV